MRYLLFYIVEIEIMQEQAQAHTLLPNGTRATIHGFSIGGEPVVEGKATVIGHNFENNYRVQFDQDEFEGIPECDRFINGEDVLADE